jgi:hypothetical protein
MAKHQSTIKTEAYILNKINKVGDTFAKAINNHAETHMQDNNQ